MAYSLNSFSSQGLESSSSFQTLKPLSIEADNALKPHVENITNIINKMDWKYRTPDCKVKDFSLEESAPLCKGVKEIKVKAREYGVKNRQLYEFCLPILFAYNAIVQKEAKEQFQAELQFFESGDCKMPPEEISDEIDRIKFKILIYEKEMGENIYFIEHVKLKLNLGETRRDSNKKVTDEEFEAGMFLFSLQDHYLLKKEPQ